MTKALPTAKEADIILLLEGSYPYVYGGVSSWVHTIITGFPEYTFAAIFIGGDEDSYEDIRYQLPPNLVHVEAHYLFSQQAPIEPRAHEGNSQAYELIGDMHEWFRHYPNKAFAPNYCDINLLLNEKHGVDFEQFLHSERSWEYITEQYDKHCSSTSFIDYFWTIRQIHHPIWRLAQIVPNAPRGKVYHAISTGYAGYLGALLHYNNPDIPLILTEHGLYTKERRIDLLRAQWTTHQHYALHADITEKNYFRELWERFFESLGRLCYEAADPIVSLFHATNDYQIEHGAQPNKTKIIPNGTQIKDLQPLKEMRPEKTPPIICLLGRVVPIKDIKTFIHASSQLKQQLPELEAWIVGPMDEDEDYAEECVKLVEDIGASEFIIFHGQQDIKKIFPDVGLMVLSSISEGLPLVIIESFAAGLPVVATNVGACSELIFGKDDEDRQLGCAGDIVDIANPSALANACYRLLSNQDLWQQAQATAAKRVNRYYDLQQMFSNYQAIYEDAMNGRDRI